MLKGSLTLDEQAVADLPNETRALAAAAATDHAAHGKQHATPRYRPLQKVRTDVRYSNPQDEI